MSDRCFLDSNIWLYAFLKDNEQKTKIASSLISENLQVVLSTQVVNEVSKNLLHKKKFTEDELTELIESFYRRYPVFQFDKNLLLKSVELRKRYQFSFWDSHIVSAALLSGCSILYAEDFHAGLVVEQKMTILNPFK